MAGPVALVALKFVGSLAIVTLPTAGVRRLTTSCSQGITFCPHGCDLQGDGRVVGCTAVARQ